MCGPSAAVKPGGTQRQVERRSREWHKGISTIELEVEGRAAGAGELVLTSTALDGGLLATSAPFRVVVSAT